LKLGWRGMKRTSKQPRFKFGPHGDAFVIAVVRDPAGAAMRSSSRWFETRLARRGDAFAVARHPAGEPVTFDRVQAVVFDRFSSDSRRN
jgi:hypothetical protein